LPCGKASKQEKEVIIMVRRVSEGIKIVILAVVREKKYDDERFGDFISRVREKYAERIDTENILLKAV
jgi:hypothetical protein